MIIDHVKKELFTPEPSTLPRSRGPNRLPKQSETDEENINMNPPLMSQNN